MTNPFVFLLVEFIVYFIATLNYRFCARGWVKSTVLTDVFLASLNFIVIKLVASDSATTADMLGYIAGAGMGSLAAMHLSKGMSHAG
jgi:hypothetical protein